MTVSDKPAVVIDTNLLISAIIRRGTPYKLLDGLQLNATFIKPIRISELPIHSRDKEDDKLLACCFGAEVEYLITGDRDLLVLAGNKALKGLKIVTAFAFLSENWV